MSLRSILKGIGCVRSSFNLFPLFSGYFPLSMILFVCQKEATICTKQAHY